MTPIGLRSRRRTTMPVSLLSFFFVMILLLQKHVVLLEAKVITTRTTTTTSVGGGGETEISATGETISSSSSSYLENNISLSTSSSTTAQEEADVDAEKKWDPLGSDLGVEQSLDTQRERDILDRIVAARKYIQDTVKRDERYATVRDICVNQHESCAYWAVLGECEKNVGYMVTNCSPVCGTCELLSVEARCPMDPNAVDAFYPGDLNRMFERIVTDPFYQQYEPVVLSRPTPAPEDIDKDPATLPYQVDGMWIVVFDRAISDEEADRLVELGAMEGYKRSSDVGVERADGTFTSHVNQGRTSTNAWCNGKCYDDPVAKRIMDRIANITGIPETNSEYLQLLRYENGQYYIRHNDYIPHQTKRPVGVRILTLYFYLSNVQEGGGTHFPVSNLTVQPRKGRAVLWPSVLNEDPNQKDPRSDHQALPVIEGLKYGANAWIHQRDFKTYNKLSCT